MNTQPLVDGGVRGLIAGMLSGLLAFVGLRLGLSAEEIALLMPTTAFLAFVLGGAYDAYVRPRLHQSPDA